MRASRPLLTVLMVALLGGCSDEHNQHLNLFGDCAGAACADWVEVTGTGEQTGVPDQFGVRAVARREGEAIAPLTEAVNAEVDAILARARKLGIPERRITASSLRVEPVWQREPQRRVSGYRVERPVIIETRGMETQASLLTELTAAGVREIRPLGTGLSNRDELEQRALEAAVADARVRATTLADSAERELGPALRIQEQGGSGPRPMALEAARARSDGSWTPGELTITRRVRVRFRLEP